MSPAQSNKRQPPGKKPVLTTHPTRVARSTRTITLLMLVSVDVIVALMMVVSLVGFIIRPDPAVKAGPMYVTLTLTTAASLIMAFMALNASFLPLVPRRQWPSVSLVMYSMGATGLVTGVLTLGTAVSPYIMRLILGTIAYVFISVQSSRLAQARKAAAAGSAAAPAGNPAAPTRSAHPGTKTRQRRGGRKH